MQVYALAQLVNSFSKKYKEQHTNLLYSDAPLAADNKEKEDKGERVKFQGRSCNSIIFNDVSVF